MTDTNMCQKCSAPMKASLALWKALHLRPSDIDRNATHRYVADMVDANHQPVPERLAAKVGVT
jgi:hypothetical protein